MHFVSLLSYELVNTIPSSNRTRFQTADLEGCFQVCGYTGFELVLITLPVSSSTDQCGISLSHTTWRLLLQIFSTRCRSSSSNELRTGLSLDVSYTPHEVSQRSPLLGGPHYLTPPKIEMPPCLSTHPGRNVPNPLSFSTTKNASSP